MPHSYRVNIDSLPVSMNVRFLLLFERGVKQDTLYNEDSALVSTVRQFQAPAAPSTAAPAASFEDLLGGGGGARTCHRQNQQT